MCWLSHFSRVITGNVASSIAMPSSWLEVGVLLCEMMRNFRLRTYYYWELHCGVISSRLGSLISSVFKFLGKSYVYVRLQLPGVFTTGAFAT